MEIDLPIGEEFGQEEKLTRRINRLLEEYTDGFAVPKELIQNADDAGATEVRFLYDERTNNDAMTGLIDEGMRECQGPALWVYNDAEFQDKDFENIIKLNGATKQQDTSKIGKFGLGFNAVYNLTDVPSFVSRNYIVFFDPHTVYLGRAITDKRKPGIKIDTNKNVWRLRAYRNQFKPYNDIFGCNLRLDTEDNSFQGTLFRFPLRTREQALRSEIKELYYDSQQMQELLELFVRGAKSLLLFTQNIRRVSIFHLPKTANANPKAQLMFEVTKSLTKVMRELTVSVTLPVTARKLSKEDQKLLQQCNVLQASSKVAQSTRDSKMTPINLLTSSLIVNIDCNVTSCGEIFFQCDTVCDAGVEQWFVVSSMGNGQAMQLSREAPNLLPSAGVAVQLKETSRGSFLPLPISNGSLFCYLPLPIISGLPVHVNGAFAVDSSRRHLQEKIGDDKACLGVKWNTALLKDPTCSAYLCLIEDLKLLCQTGGENYSYHLLWPNASSVQTNCKPLLNAFYYHLVSDRLPLFSDGKRWADITHIAFLHPDLRGNNQIGDVSLKAFRLLMKGKTVVVDLPPHVFQSFQECGLGEVIRPGCYSKIRFFQEVFFPNISSVPSYLRDDLVLHVLDAWNAEFDQLLKSVPCIPATPRGEILQRPGRLIHPEKEAASLFLLDEGRFPLGCNDRFQTPLRLARLEQLGMCTDDLPWEEVAERAESIQHLYAVNIKAGISRVEALISFLDKKLRRKVKRSPSQAPRVLSTKGRLKQKSILSDATQKRLAEAKFLPVLKRPNSFPLPWKGDEFQVLMAPEDVFSEKLKYLVCCAEPLVGVVISEDVKKILKIKAEGLTLYHIMSQLDAALSCDIETLDPTGYREVKQVCLSVFFHLQDALDNHGGSIKQYFHRKEFVLVGRRFLSADQVAFALATDCSPYLYKLPEEYASSFRRLMIEAGVKQSFESEDFIAGLRKIKLEFGERKLNDRSLQVAVDLANQLSESLNISAEDLNQTLSECGEIFLPDSKRVMRPVHDLCMKNVNCPWIQDDSGVFFVHDRIPWSTCRILRVKTRREEALQHHAVGISFGQKEKLVNRLKRILTSYPCEKEILKELLQNADDAQATEIYFIKDPRRHPDIRVFEDSWKPLQGPALCVYNNKPFTKADIEGIQNLGEGSKGNDPNKTGQYGVGFNAVYHLTDVPSFKSKSREIGDVLGVFDPHCKYVPGASPHEPGRLFEDTKTLKEKFPDVFPCYLEDHFSTENATMFRFPLRNEMMAAKSKISSSEVTVRTLDVMMEDLKKELFEVLLFVNNVEKITLCSINEYTGNLVNAYSVEVEISDKDKDERQQFAAYIGKIAKKIKESCMFTPCKIPVKKCSYVLNVTDSLGNKERWFVVQQVGFEKPVDESIVKAFKKRDLGMLPRGGVACLLESTRKEHKRRKAYCFLPLPLETDLPVHINGHFALDHEARRNLWWDERGGYRSDWNNALLSDVIASCYLTILDKARNFMKLPVPTGSTSCNVRCSRNVIMHRINAYEKLFPCISSEETHWATLVRSVYQEMNEKGLRVLPVVSDAAQHPSALAMPSVQLNWLPPTGSGKNRAFFNTLAVTGCLAEEHSKFESTDTKVLRAKKRKVFESTLLETGFNLVAFSVLVLESLQRSGVNANGITPSSVVEFYRTFRSRDPLCKIGSIPTLVEDTAFKSASNVCLLLQYCRDDPDFLDKLPGLPLLLTQDNVLRAFEERCPKFLSSYQDILPGSPDLFVHEELRKRIFNNVASLEAPVFETLNAKGLANSLHSTLSLDYYGAKEFVRWFPKETEVPNQRWIYRVWNFLRELAAEILNDTEITPEIRVRRIRDMLEPLSERCILPVTRRAFKRLRFGFGSLGSSKTTEHFLVPLRLAESVLDLSNTGTPKLVDILRGVGLPELNSVVLSTPDTKTIAFRKSDSYRFALHLVATLENPASLLVSLDGMMKSNPFSLEEMLELSDCMMILQYFSNNVHSLTVIDKSILTKMPFYPAVHGGTTRVDQHRVCVLPVGVPRVEIEKLEQATHVLFLEYFDSLAMLYDFLEFEGISPVDVYCAFILRDFEVFSPKARLAHLTYVRGSLLQLVETQKEKELLKTLSTVKIIPSKDGTLKAASSFYDPCNTVFRTMLSDEAFPSSPLDCPYEWLPFLRKIGLVHDVTCDHFLHFAREVAREAATRKHEDMREKSKVLVSHLFTRPNAAREGLFANVCSIPFLPVDPLSPPLRALCQSHEESRCAQMPYIAFKGSVTEEHAEIVWTEADLLPSWADPRKHSCPREAPGQLQVVTKPTVALVISHCHNICFRFENSTGKENISPEKCHTLKVVLEQIYTFLQQNALGCSEAKECLRSTPCILVENGRKLLRPKQVVLELYENLQIKPFLYRLPPEFGKYQTLFQYLGCSKSVTASHYTNVLEMMHDQSKGLKLHPNEITKASEAIKGLLKTLQEDVEKAPAFSCLFLPAMSPRHGTQDGPIPVSLHNSTELLFNDMNRYGSRLKSLEHLFVVDSKTIEVDLENLMMLLPNEVRPKMISCAVKEKLNEPASGEVVFGGAIDVLKNKISSPQFIKGVLRLIRHDNRGRKPLDEDTLANVESKLRRVEFVSMDRIVTTLFHLDAPIAESELEVPYFIKKILDSDQEVWKVYVNGTTAVENSFSEITLAITNVIIEACEGLLKETAKFIPEMLRINPRDIHSLLDKMNIGHGVTDLGDIYPDPGDFIPIEDHHLLDENFEEFERGEYVGYELDDPSLQMEDGNPTYIYAVVLEEILSEGCWSLLSRKYKILIGENEEPIEAEAADLYKFHRLQVVASSALVPLGKQDDRPMQRYKEKVFKEISDALVEAWRLPEESRRKIIKRLLLRWHPDKNPGNETFCRAVFQHLQNELEQLKVQNIEILFETLGARAKTHQSQRQMYRTKFLQHYDSLESSRKRSWRPVPPSFSTKNPQPEESKRWFRQAEKDLAAAKNDIATTRPSHEWACFKCHQAAEKALKAAQYLIDATKENTHNLTQICHLLGDSKLTDLAHKLECRVGDSARMRYPDRMCYPRIPNDEYSEQMALDAIELAKSILCKVKNRYS